MKNKSTLPAVLAATLLISACAINPKPYAPEAIQERVKSDRQLMYAEQEPVTAPITFQEAAARALKYNLDYRLKLMESALSKSLRDVSAHEMLPNLVASAGRAGRSNDSGGTSVSITSGIETLSPSTSQERYRDLGNLGLSWSVLDFGIAYYRTQQKSDQILMAEERRRKVAQNVLQDVRNAYWRALGAQRLIGQVESLQTRVKGALQSARTAEEKGLLPRQQALAYQRALLDAVSLLNLRRQDLELSRSELSALMSLPPGTLFFLADSEELKLPAPSHNMASLERMALERRPEIMEEWYRKRVTQADIEVAKVQLWPNIGVDANAQYDSNKYLYNNTWVDYGFRASLNLMKLLQLPSLNEAQSNQNQVDDLRRLALSMAILTQVRVGNQRYQLALDELQFADEGMRVDTRLLDYARAAARTSVDSELEVIRAEARALLSRYQRYVAYSNAQTAWGQLYNSIGLDVLPTEITSHDIKTLAAGIQVTLTDWEKTAFPPEAESARAIQAK